MVEKTSTAVETGIAVDRSYTSEVGSKSAEGGISSGVVASFSSDGVVLEGGDEGDEDLEAGTPAEGSEAEPGDEGDTSDPAEGDDLPDLGEWDGSNEEVRAKFDARYFSEDGKLNAEVISNEFWAGADKDKPGGLKPSTYEYLQETLGLTKEFIEQVEAGLVATNEKTTNQFFERVGGKDRYEAAITWGKGGGYTKAQQDRFNTLRAKGGPDFEDAVDALMARFDKANPPTADARRGPPRRASTPARDVTASAATASGGVQGYPDYTSYQADMRAAQKSGDAKKQADVRAKLKASSFYRKNPT